MRASILPPTADLIERVAAHLVPVERDFSACRVVFPGRRPAHFVRAALARRVGGAFLPPVIHAIDDFVEFIGRKHLPEETRVAGPLDTVRLLFGIHRALPERLGGDQFQSLERFLPLGLRLFQELEELALTMATPQAFRGAVAIAPTGQLHLVAEISDRLSAELSRRGMTTRARLYATAAQEFSEHDLDGVRQLVFAGFYGLSPAESMLMAKAGRLERTSFFFTDGPGLARRIEALGVQAEPVETLNGPAPEVFLTESPDVHGEVFAVAEDIRERVAHGLTPDVNSVIVLPQPDALFPLLHHALIQLPDDGYNISLGFPFVRTPLAALFHSFHNAAATVMSDRFLISAYLRILLHPYVKNVRYGRRSDVTRILVHTIEERLAEAGGRGTVMPEEIENDDELFTRCLYRMPEDVHLDEEALRAHLRSIHGTFFRSWRRAGTVGEFATACAGVVQAVHDGTTASLHPTFRQFAESFLEMLRTLGRSLLSDVSLTDDAQYLGLLARIMASESVPFPGSPLHGLQVLGVLETRSLKFDDVVLLDANDDILPGREAAGAIIPQRVRESLGMERRTDREEIMKYHVSALVRGARRVRILYVTGGGRERSRIVEGLVWEKQLAARSLAAAGERDAVRYRVTLDTGGPAPAPKTGAMVAALRRRRYSATALDAYLRCPLRFYHATVLGIREMEEAADDIERSDLGLLVHAVLQEYFAPHVGKVLDPALLNRVDAERLAAATFDSRFGAPDTAAKVLMKERMTARVGEYVEQVQAPIAGRLRVEILGLEVTEEAVIGGARFGIRMDRVERRTDEKGRIAEHILDYKTGGRATDLRIRFDRLDPAQRETWNPAIGSLQLAIYGLVHAEARGLRPDGIRAAYQFLGRREMSPAIEVDMLGPGITPEDGLAKARAVVEGLVGELFDPAMEFVPTKDLEKECPRCPFTTICGTTWTVDRREQ